MKKTAKHIILIFISLLLLSCTETVRHHPHAYHTSELIETPTNIELPKTTGQFRRIEFEKGFAKEYAGTSLKIVVFPKSIGLKSFYIPINKDGSFTIEYKYENNIETSNEVKSIGEMILKSTDNSNSLKFRLFYNPILNEQ